MSWLLALNRRKKVAVYCSDVSGAFDRVRAERLLEKLRCKGVHPTMVALTESWLRQRTAHVVVEGQFSDKMVLRNMVFQGTVLGPSLWNLFYEDARRAIHETGCEEIVYADDLNGFKGVDSVLTDAKKCQTELHKWGRANQVSKTQRRNLRTSCLTPSRMETLLNCSESASTANSRWTWPYETWLVRLLGN